VNHQNERRKRTCRKITDGELVTIITALRAGVTVNPSTALAADDFKQELARRCDTHLEMFGLG
jgi:hypothetical protein